MPPEKEIEENARITGWDIGSDDHGGLTMSLSLKYKRGSEQSFTGYDLRWWGAYFIERVLDIVGVERCSELPGKVIRVRREPFGLIRAIGNIIDDQLWFEPGEQAERAAAIRARKMGGND